MTNFILKDTELIISPSFLILLAWLNFLDQDAILLQGLLGCFFHELGHIFVILAYHERITSISLSIIGAEIKTKHNFSYFSYPQELLCTLSGVMVNFFLALVCSNFPKTQLFAGINLALALLNLLPMSQLDGGRAIQCLLSLFLPLWQRDFCINLLDFLCATFLLALGFWIFLEGGTITLFFLGIWLVQSISWFPEKTKKTP